MSGMRYAAAAAAAIGITIATAVAALSAGGIPGPNGVIEGCYGTAKGDLRVVTDPTQCKTNEVSLSWSQTGPTGLTGPTGPQGPRGDTGAAGPAGPQGLVWRGTYSSTTAYDVNDAVQSGGSSYIAVLSVTPSSCASVCVDPNAPGLSSKWQILAAQGASGVGAMGPTGATGAAGPQGPAVMSAAYETYRFSSSDLPPTPGDMVLADISLPAGSFVVIGDARFENWNSGTLVDNDRVVACTLAEAGTGFDNGEVAYMTIPGPSKFHASVPLLRGYTRGSPSTIELRCRVDDSSQSPSSIFAHGVDLVAIPVSNLTFKRNGP